MPLDAAPLGAVKPPVDQVDEDIGLEVCAIHIRAISPPGHQASAVQHWLRRQLSNFLLPCAR
jgi:hypothetical protein